MGTNCVPLVADLFMFCYERDFMLSLSDDNQSGVIEAFNSTSRYLDDLLNIDNNFFDSMVNRIYPSELQLNKANVSDAEASFLDLHLSISDGFEKTKNYDKRDDFDFDIGNFPFLDGDVPRSASYGVYISQLIRFARVSSHVDDFNTWVRYPVWQHTFVSPSAFSRRAVVSYWRKYVHEVLVNRLGGLSLPRKSVVRLTDRPDMTLDVYRGRKITKQQQQQQRL